MSMNVSAAGGNYTPVDFALSPVAPTGGQSAAIEQQPSSAPAGSSSVSNMSDLKKAELRGEKYTISDEQVIKALERALKSMQGQPTSLEFSIHEKTKSISVKVLNADTGEVIREIPPEKTLDLVAKLWEMAGLFVDERG